MVSSYVYLLPNIARSAFKVGISICPRERIQQIGADLAQEECVAFCVDSGSAHIIERKLHRVLDQWRLPVQAYRSGNTEWFDIAGFDLAKAICVEFADYLGVHRVLREADLFSTKQRGRPANMIRVSTEPLNWNADARYIPGERTRLSGGAQNRRLERACYDENCHGLLEKNGAVALVIFDIFRGEDLAKLVTPYKYFLGALKDEESDYIFLEFDQLSYLFLKLAPIGDTTFYPPVSPALHGAIERHYPTSSPLLKAA